MTALRKWFGNAGVFAVGALLLGFQTPVKAKSTLDHHVKLGWRAYLGCWQPQAEEGAEMKGVVCFIPSSIAKGDVEMLTISDNEVKHTKIFYTDDTVHSIEGVDKCEGTESARFSGDGLRIYTASSVACEGEAMRDSEGIISMPFPGEWVDVRSMEARGRTMAWAQWYKRASNGVLEELELISLDELNRYSAQASRWGAEGVSIEQVIDAVEEQANPSALEAWIAEIRQPFPGLNSKDLIRLDDSGVPGSIVNIIVAVSFPDKFSFGDEMNSGDYRVSKKTPAPPPSGGYARVHHHYYSPYDYYRPGYYDYYDYYHRHCYGYYGWRSYRGCWGYGYPPVIVYTSRVRRPRGRVISNRGYRRLRRYQEESPRRRGGGGVPRVGGGSQQPPRTAKPRRGGSGGRVGTGTARPRRPVRSGGGGGSARRKPVRRGGKTDQATTTQQTTVRQTTVRQTQPPRPTTVRPTTVRQTQPTRRRVVTPRRLPTARPTSRPSSTTRRTVRPRTGTVKKTQTTRKTVRPRTATVKRAQTSGTTSGKTRKAKAKVKPKRKN